MSYKGKKDKRSEKFVKTAEHKDTKSKHKSESKKSDKKEDSSKSAHLVKLTQEEDVGIYRITTEVLGMGSFGIVYKGIALYSPHPAVAVKIICKNDLNEHRMARLKTEIELLQLLDHKNVVKLLNVYENDENVYLVFEYKSGDLYSYIQTKGPVSEMIAMEIFRQLVEAVEYCHSMGVVHLDIKLENILIDDSTLEVYLADFGFATYFQPDSKMEKWCGSPFTVAPEIITRTAYDPQLVDVWALGSVLYTILNGSYPFQAPNVNEVLQKTRSGKLNNFHSSVGYSVRDMIVKILVLDTNKRANMVQLKAHPWYRLAEGVSKVPDKIRIAQGLPAKKKVPTVKQSSPRNIQSRR